MLSLVRLLFSAVFLVCFLSKAQEISVKDTINGNELSISMDSRLETLLKSEENKCATLSKSGEKSSGTGRRNSASTGASSSPKVKSVASRPLTRAEICQRTPKMRGFKIQLTVVKSNEEANEVKAYFRRRFPYLKTQTDASLRPNYKILAGSYFSRESARGDFSAIKSVFKGASLVEYSIYCVEAK